MATCSACASGDMLRWMTPMPPAWAMAIARLPSVTVSMAEEMTGIFTAISRVTLELTSTSAGRTSEGRGASSTSSKVSATVVSSRIGRCAMGYLPRA